MSKILSVIMAVLMTIGFAAATVDMGQSLSYSFTGLTAGASYSEGGTFNLGMEDALQLNSVFSFDNAGNMFGQTEFHVQDNFVGTTISGGDTMIYPGHSEHGATDGGAAGQTNNGNGNGGYDNGHHGGPQVVSDFSPVVTFTQNMDYIKDFTAPVDPRMNNQLFMDGGNMDVTAFMGSKMSGVQIGLAANVTGGTHFRFYGYTTDDQFKPIASGYLNANDFDGFVSVKDKFSFDRNTQLHNAAFMYNSSL